MSSQAQFLNVIDRDAAEARFRAALSLRPLAVDQVPLCDALGRVLARDVMARVDVPSFDRSNFDGYAIQAADSFGATELTPRLVKLLPVSIDAGVASDAEVGPGEAVAIATGGMVPRGADAILMVENSEVIDAELVIRKAVTPGAGVAFAGGDIAIGETVLRIGTLLTSRETGVLAAIGEDSIPVWRRPLVSIISTGDELIEPGRSMRPPQVYDSNARILADSVRELGGLPRVWGIVKDDADALRKTLHAALDESDVVLLSGGTSKGQGDLCYSVVAELNDPGIVAHGVALKPGKPICLAASAGKPVVVLPGFPTSAIFTFHEFVAPVIAMLGGRREEARELLPARMAVRTNSEIGRTEYLLVNLVQSEAGLVAYPMGKGSGSVTTFSRADGFVTIGRHTEIVEAGQQVEVRAIGRGLVLADLVVIGSHCVGLDYLLSRLHQQGLTSKLITVGSTAGLAAVRRGECDIAGIHLLDPQSGEYNRPFIDAEMELLTGYGRRQGIVYRRGDTRFEGRSIEELAPLLRRTQTALPSTEPLPASEPRTIPSFPRGKPPTNSPLSRITSPQIPPLPLKKSPQIPALPLKKSPQIPPLPLGEGRGEGTCIMVNRNQGSGTRILIDELLAGHQPAGYAVQPTTHNAVAAAVAQGRADWGMAIESVAQASGLGFILYQDEQYDFVLSKARSHRPPVRAFRQILADRSTREQLARFGFRVTQS